MAKMPPKTPQHKRLAVGMKPGAAPIGAMPVMKKGGKVKAKAKAKKGKK